MNYESIINLLYTQAPYNSNIQAIIDKIPEIRRYWSNRNSNMTLASLASSSSVNYNPDNATNPGFFFIDSKNNDMLTNLHVRTYNRYEPSIMAGTLHIYNDISTVNLPERFLTPAMKIGYFSNFDGIYLALSDRSWGSNGYSSQPAGPQGTALLLSTANSLSLTLYSNSNFGQLYTQSNFAMLNTWNLIYPSGIDKYFCFACDGFNYWLGVASTVNDPQFTWSKIMTALQMSSLSLSFTFGGFKYVSTSQSTGQLDLTCTAWTGVLPWN